jgi:hypothetical protein
MAAKENFTVTWNEKDEIKLTHDLIYHDLDIT